METRAGGSFSGLFFLLQFSTGGEERPAIWLNAGIHSREWISQATAIWTARKVMSPGISQGFWWAPGGLQHPPWLGAGDEVGRCFVGWGLFRSEK